MRTYRIIALMLLCLALNGWAAPTVSIDVERTDVVVGERFIIYLMIEAEGKINVARAPSGDGFEIDSDPVQRNSSSSINIINSKLTRSTQQRLGYAATVSKVGAMVIPPFKVEIDGKPFRSNTLELTAIASDAVKLPTGRRPQANRREDNEGDKQQSLSIEDAAWAETTVDKTSVYQGEAITCTLRIYRLSHPNITVRFAGRSNLALPPMEGFYKTTPNSHELRIQQDGLTYDVQEIKILLFPMNSGGLKIGTWSYPVEIYVPDGFGHRRHSRQLSANPIMITVQPLPERPASFRGAVGDFSITASLKRDEVLQGTPTTFQVVLTGQGNADAIGAPVLPDIPWAYIAEPDIEDGISNAEAQGKVEKIYIYNLTPLEVGEFIFPSIDYSFFSPDKKAYLRISTDPIALRVRGTENQQLVAHGGTQGADRNVVKIFGTDIEALALTLPRLHRRSPGSFWYIFFLILPPLFYLAHTVFMRQRKRLREDSGYARSRFARSKSRKRIHHASQADEPVDALYRALTGYLADKCNVNEAGITSSDARALLEAQGIAEELVDGVEKILRNCERALYGADTLHEMEFSALLHGAEAAMDRLDAAWSKGGGR